jgi:hypothetical protein
MTPQQFIPGVTNAVPNAAPSTGSAPQSAPMDNPWDLLRARQVRVDTGEAVRARTEEFSRTLEALGIGDPTRILNLQPQCYEDNMLHGQDSKSQPYAGRIAPFAIRPTDLIFVADPESPSGWNLVQVQGGNPTNQWNLYYSVRELVGKSVVIHRPATTGRQVKVPKTKHILLPEAYAGTLLQWARVWQAANE